MALCSKCGSPLKDGAKFCTFCGERIIEHTTFSEHEFFEESTAIKRYSSAGIVYCGGIL